MPSTKLADCHTGLANAWIWIRETYHAQHPGHELILTCTHRPQEEQYALYCKGRRQLPDGSWVVDEDPKTSIVTNCDGWKIVSKHNRKPAEAIDFAVVIAGKISWDHREYEPVGRLGEERGLVWGGRWTSIKDYPHLEVRRS